MNILVTGAKGMVGTALVNNLKNIRDGKNRTRNIEINEIYEYDLDSTEAELDEYCAKADFVFNLAGVNRLKNPEDFMKGNFGFASQLLDTLKKHNNKAGILLRFRQHFQDGLVIVNMEEARRPEKNCSLNMEKRQEHRYMYTVL